VPEGHTLHRLAATLGDALVGDRVRSTSPQGRFAESAALLDGRVLDSTEAYGKHLFAGFGTDPFADVVHVHLGLYGRFDVTPHDGEVPDPVGQVRWRLVGERAYADLRGATACELLTPPERDALLARLGPDPLRPDADPEAAWARISRSRAPIAGLLMDQSVVAGIGNVYRAELLYRHRVDPFRPGRSLRPRQWQEMWDDLVALMADGVRVGAIRTVRAEDLAPHERRGRASYVYRRAGDPCRVCGTRVRTTELQGRNLFWCPRCQRPHRPRVRP
jgi:endonuclease VIII